MSDMHCNVCGATLASAVYDSGSDKALTSLCELRTGRVRVWACSACSHLRGEALPDVDAYYETDYRILLDHEDEDQIYEVKGDRIVYRTEHQLNTLLSKLPLAPKASLLDYGCAKASTPARLLSQRPDLDMHLFDVSEMYTAYWDRIVAPAKRATFRTPENWQSSFDAVTSFFALEHIPEPIDTVRRVAALLKEDGRFYGIVPDTFGNVADFVVIDHVNHFTSASLHVLLRRAGFVDIEIDSHAHRGALVFVAGRSGILTPAPDPKAAVKRSLELAAYWSSIGARIRHAEQTNRNGSSAIYGSGFYGAYIASALSSLERVECFLDRSPFRQGKSMFGKPIVAPEDIPAEIGTLYVGLNPSIARASIGPDLADKPGLNLVFMDTTGT